MRRRIVLLSFLFFGFSISLGSALSGVKTASANEDAGAFIMAMANKALTTLTDPEMDDALRAELFRDLVRDGLNIPYIAERVLGPYRARATEEEMAEFKTLLEEYIVRTYAILFKGYNGETMELVGVKTGRRGTEEVTVRVFTAENSPPVETRWAVVDVDGMYKVNDIVIERSSMVRTQSAEFVSVIRRGGGEIRALLDELVSRNEELAHNIQS